jgi:hypothetical protein
MRHGYRLTHIKAVQARMQQGNPGVALACPEKHEAALMWQPRSLEEFQLYGY